ncbi:LysR family transcriptional regulator [Marinomonas posidonica]|uniref:Transcriptional regulator, LysR family n=1 Tax=Marinomonas posidonica (strain CECT 7376 / NCIMB 14433 / IVIA-Po-181) TaxID=491952 RepID=F6CZF2_MARPP|nr:LysR family transcriptional regulator [Marinomonas posidonica]AEF54689.1 transcriptional regulator, LysR family [Marinomonas posidonica IVIA-Po-181]
MKITLQQIRVFSAVARHGNLTSAAEVLCLSKGALSQSLQQLESHLDTPLFDRAHPRLQLNQQGKRLLPMADELIGRAGDIERTFGKHIDNLGALHIGASQTIGNYLLPYLLAEQDVQQQQETKVTITNSQTLCKMLLNFELDMALIEGQHSHQALTTTPWIQDTMLLVCSAEHPLAQKASITFNELNNQNWVLRETASGSRQQFERRIRPALSDITSVLELSSLESVLLAVERGLGVSFISNLAAKDKLDMGRIHKINIEQNFPRQLHLVWHKQKYLTGRLQHFSQFLKDWGEQYNLS